MLLPLQLILCIGLALFAGHLFSDPVITVIYTGSCFLKDSLVWILPWIVLTYIADALIKISPKQRSFVFLILAGVFVSNFIAVLIGYGVGNVLFPWLSLTTSTQPVIKELIHPLYIFPWKPLITTDKALLVGLVVGFILNFYPVRQGIKIIETAKHYLSLFLSKVFVPFLPLYVLGFLLKMGREGLLAALLGTSVQVTIMGLCLIVIYVVFLYAVSQRFQVRPLLSALNNMLPAGLTGFSTMSSAVAMPVTLMGTEKNLPHNPNFGQLIIPMTVNTHLLGDSLFIPLLILAVKVMFGEAPWFPLETFLSFTFSYCVIKFSVAAVPGGGVLVLLPLFYSSLGLSSEMISIITTLYILLDPVLTFSNVMGNGGFALLMEKLLNKKRGSA